MRYPAINTPCSFIECPVHRLAVALGEDGRIASTCPRCLLDAVRALARMRRGH